MELISSILCTRAITDARTKMVSLIDVTDILNLDENELPPFDPKSKEEIAIGPTTLNLAVWWRRSDPETPEQGVFKTVLLTPDKKKFAHAEIGVDLQGKAVSQSTLMISNLIFRGLGYYYFLVEKKNTGQKRWSKCATLPLLLRAHQEEMLPTTSKKDLASSEAKQPSGRSRAVRKKSSPKP
jgi:hypothetical protein